MSGQGIGGRRYRLGTHPTGINKPRKIKEVKGRILEESWQPCELSKIDNT
jgi:hypothetical protein